MSAQMECPLDGHEMVAVALVGGIVQQRDIAATDVGLVARKSCSSRFSTASPLGDAYYENLFA